MLTPRDTSDHFAVLRLIREYIPGVGGSKTHILELAQAMEPYLSDQLIFAPGVPECESFDQVFPVEIIRAGNTVTRIGSPIVDDFRYSQAIREELIALIRQRSINVVHIHSPVLAAYVIPFLRKSCPDLKIVVMAHGWPEKKDRSFGVSYTVGKRLISSAPPDHYIILEDGSQIWDLQKVLDKRSIPWSTVYHAIDTSTYRPTFPAATEQFSILFPHRPIPIKNPDLALTIFHKFFAEINDTDVSLIFPAKDLFLANKPIAIPKDISNNVLLLGNLNQGMMIDQINRSSVIIGTSLNSNTGRATQEAMACEKPVIVFNNGKISDLISPGNNGLLVEPGDIVGFVDALKLLYKNPDLGKSIGINARETIIRDRSWDKRIDSELSVYRTIVE